MTSRYQLDKKNVGGGVSSFWFPRKMKSELTSHFCYGGQINS